MRSAKMFFVFLLVQPISLLYAAGIPSPVIVQVETDSTKSFHLGPYDRTRFDLVEQFHPLQTASVAKGDKKQELRLKLQGLNAVQLQRMEPTNQLAIVPVYYGSKEENPASLTQRLIFGEWMEWSAWTPCLHRERNRVRTCLPRRPASRVVCHGAAKEKQQCFSSKEHHVAVAKDPWTIEREISGDFKT